MKQHNQQYASVETDDVEAPGAHSSQKARPLTLLPLIAIIFFEVSGGPFGTEVSIMLFRQLLAVSRMLVSAVQGDISGPYSSLLACMFVTDRTLLGVQAVNEPSWM